MTKPAYVYKQGMLHVQSITLTFSDEDTQKEICTVPSGATIIKPISGVQVNTAFNAGTTNTIDIGTTANDDLYGSALAGGTATFVPLDENVNLTMSTDTTLYALYEGTGTAASAGSAEVVIAYTL